MAENFLAKGISGQELFGELVRIIDDCEVIGNKMNRYSYISDEVLGCLLLMKKRSTDCIEIIFQMEFFPKSILLICLPKEKE